MGLRRSTFVCFALLTALALCCSAPALALEPAGDGWYWQLPQPQGGRALYGLAMPDAQHVWAVGSAGTVLASADGGFDWQVQDTPTSDPLRAVAFTDALHGCAVGGWQTNAFTGAGVKSAVILHTADGGSSWTQAVQPSSWGLSDVVFTDALTGIAVGQHGTVLRTVDGGLTWTTCPSGTRQDFGGVAFTDPQHGYALADSRYVARTVDGGLTWRTAPAREYYWDFADGLAADGSGALWTSSSTPWDDGMLQRSSDGGRTWKSVKAGGSASYRDVAASGARICAVSIVDSGDSSHPVHDTSLVSVSTDGGGTWSRHLLGQGVETAAAVLGGSTGICASGAGLVASSDDGATWFGSGSRPSGTGSVDFVSPTDGWSTSSDYWMTFVPYSAYATRPTGSILHTSDGVTWQQQYSSPAQYFLDVDFADGQSGWAVGARGAILHTADGGVAWSAQGAASTRTTFTQVQAPDAQDAWVLGHTGDAREAVLLRTVDGGIVWDSVLLPKGFTPLCMSFRSAEEGWLAGWGAKSAAKVAHTTDGGVTWTVSTLPQLPKLAAPLAIDFVDQTHGWITDLVMGDSSSVVLRTTDGGATWAAVGQTFADQTLTGLDFVDADHGWVSGDGVWGTSDGGASWQACVEGLVAGSGLSAVDTTHAWASSPLSGIVSTVDGSGDTAPPTTLSEGARGWLRRGTTITLGANDTGGSGVAATEYRVDGGAWQQYAAPLGFPAPADHSGDGRHAIEYRSTDRGGLVESVQSLRVDVDTIPPVIRVRPSTKGRDGVLRLHLRIDDASCPSVSAFELRFRNRRGRTLTTVEYQGVKLPTNRWYTFRSRGVQIYDGSPGVYWVSLYARDRAGNKPARVGTARLVVLRRPTRRTVRPPAPETGLDWSGR
jgi:photosystem II stability/assembly factor-like uncharacterized protein